MHADNNRRISIQRALAFNALCRAGIVTTVQKRYSEFERLRKFLAASCKARVMAVSFPKKLHIGLKSKFGLGKDGANDMAQARAFKPRNNYIWSSITEANSRSPCRSSASACSPRGSMRS